MSANNINVNLSFTADTQKAQAALQNLQTSLNNISTSTALGGSSSLAITKRIQEGVQAAAELQVHLKNAINTDTGNLSFTKLNQSLKQSGESLASYGQKLKGLGPEGAQAFNQLTSSVMKAEMPIKRTSKMLTNFAQTLKNTAKWQISSSIMHGFSGALSSAYNYAKDLNESLNNIRIVTGNSAEQMAEFAKQANKAAKSLSTTTTAYTDASLIFYQQGLNGKDVLDRTDVVVKMANVTKQSVEEVADQMTAIWNNFYNGTKSLEYYGDVLTKLGAQTASSTDEIANGLEKFIAIGDTIGLSYEYAASALATITAETRQSEEVVGTALKTIFARIQGLKLGESLEDGTSLNKYSQALQSIGIDILDANDELKNMDTILNEMGAKWGTLSEAQKAALAQTVAGVRQYNQLISLMENWDVMQKNVQMSKTSAGELDKQHEIYEEGWEAASKRVKSSLEDVYTKLIDDDFFIGFLNLLSEAVEGVSALVDAFGGLGGVLNAIGLLVTNILSKQMAAGLKNMVSNISLMLPGGEQRAQIKRNAEINSMIEVMRGDGKNAANNTRAEGMETQLRLQGEMADKVKNMSSVEAEVNKILIERHALLNEEKAKQEEKLALIQSQKTEMEQSISAAVTRNTTQAGGNVADNQTTKKDNINVINAEAKYQAAAKRVQDEVRQGDVSKEALDALKAAYGDLAEAADKAKIKIDDSLEITDDVAEATADLETFSQKLVNAREGANDVGGVAQSNLAGAIAGGSKDETAIKKANELAAGYREVAAEEANTTAGVERLGRETLKAGEMAKQGLDKVKGGFRDWSTAVVGAAQGVMSFSMAIQQAIGLVNVWKNPDMKPWEKILTTATSLGMIIPMIASGFSGLTSAVWANNAAWYASPWLWAAVIIAAIVAICFAFQDQDTALEKATKNLEQATEAYNNAKQAAEDFKNSISNYDSAVNALDNLIAGTVEYQEQVRKANEEMMKLISQYGLMKDQDYTIDANGVITLNKDTQLRIQETLMTNKYVTGRGQQVAQAKVYEEEKAEKLAKEVFNQAGAELSKDLRAYADMTAEQQENFKLSVHQQLGNMVNEGKTNTAEYKYAKSLQENVDKIDQLNTTTQLQIDAVKANTSALLNEQYGQDFVDKVGGEAQLAGTLAAITKDVLTVEGEDGEPQDLLKKMDEEGNNVFSSSIAADAMSRALGLTGDTKVAWGEGSGFDYDEKSGTVSLVVTDAEGGNKKVEYTEEQFREAFARYMNPEAYSKENIYDYSQNEANQDKIRENLGDMYSPGETAYVGGNAAIVKDEQGKWRFETQDQLTNEGENSSEDKLSKDIFMEAYGTASRNFTAGKLKFGDGVESDVQVTTVEGGQKMATAGDNVYPVIEVGEGKYIPDMQYTYKHGKYMTGANGELTYGTTQLANEKDGILTDGLEGFSGITSNEINSLINKLGNDEDPTDIMKNIGAVLAQATDKTAKKEMFNNILNMDTDTLQNKDTLTSTLNEIKKSTMISKGAADAGMGDVKEYEVVMKGVEQSEQGAKALKGLTKGTVDYTKALTALTTAEINNQKKSKQLAETYADIKEDLDPAKKSTTEYATACGKLATALNDFTGTTAFNAEIVSKYPEVMKQAVEGGPEEIQQALNLAESETYLSVGLKLSEKIGPNGETIQQYINGEIGDINVNDIEIGTSLDKAGLTDGYQRLLDEGKISADKLQEILSLKGFDDAIEFQKVTLDSKTVTNTDGTLTLPDPKNPGGTITVPAENAAEVQSQGYYMMPVIKGDTIKVRSPITISDNLRQYNKGTKTGSGKKQKVSKKRELVDRYQPVQDKLEEQKQVLEEISDLENHLYGDDKITALERKNKAIAAENQLLEEKLKLNRKYQAEDRAELEAFAKKKKIDLKFDDNGILLNQTDIQNALADKVIADEKANKEDSTAKDDLDEFNKLFKNYKETNTDGLDILKEIFDNYYEEIENINKKHEAQLEKINKDHEKNQKLLDKSYGKDRILGAQAIRQDILNSVEEIDKVMLPELYTKRKGEIDAIFKESGMQVQLDNKGQIVNEDDVTKKLQDKIDNAKTPEEVTQAKEIYSRVMARLGVISELSNSITGLFDEKETQYDNFTNSFWEEFDNTVELRGIITELEINKIDVTDVFIKDTDFAKRIQSDMERYEIGAREMQDAFKGYGDLMKMSDEVKNTAEWQERAKKQAQEMADSVVSSWEEYLDLFEGYKDIFSEIQDMANEVFEDYSKINDELEHYQNLVDALGNEKDYDAIEEIANASLYNTKAKLQELTNYQNQVLKPQRDKLAEDIANGMYIGEALDKAKEELRALDGLISDTTSEINATLEQAVEEANKILENGLNRAIDMFEKTLTGGFSLEEMVASIERLTKSQEEYLTKTNQMYETNKMIRQAQLEIDKTDNLIAKQKYQGFIKETEQLANQEKLSQQDLKIAQARYQLLQAQIALEEAQKNKDSMRLVRNASGNWDYVYTANQDKIAEAEGKVADAENSLYNLGLEGAQNYRDKILAADQEFAEKAKEINEQYKNDEKKRQEELDALLSHHLLIRKTYEEQYYNAYDLLVSESTTNYADYMLGNIATTEEFEKAATKMYGTIDGLAAAWQAETAEANELVNSSYNTLYSNLGNVYEQTDAISNQINNELVPRLVNEADAVGKAANSWLSLYNNAKLANQERGKQAKNALNAAQQASTNNFDYMAASDWSTEMLKALMGTSEYTYAEAYANREKKIDKTKNDYGYTTKEINDILYHANTHGYLKVLENTPLAEWPKVVAAKEEELKKKKENDVATFDTGGYTGSWGPDGKFALLHQKELVLNAQDTENLLTTVDTVRDIVQSLDLQKLSYLDNLKNLFTTSGFSSFGKNNEDKAYHFTFGDLVLPNVSDAQDFANTLQDIVNDAIVHSNLN